MAFLEVLQEMLTRTQVADLARNVAIMSVDRAEAGEPKRYLNMNIAANGEVEWAQANSPGIFIMKGKFLKNIYPTIKGKLGKAKFVDRDAIRDEIGYGQVGAIQADSPSVGFDRSIRGGMGGAE